MVEDSLAVISTQYNPVVLHAIAAWVHQQQIVVNDDPLGSGFIITVWVSAPCREVAVVVLTGIHDSHVATPDHVVFKGNIRDLGAIAALPSCRFQQEVSSILSACPGILDYIAGHQRALD